MLNDRFLQRLYDAFPEFYARVDEEARAEAARLRVETGGDVAKALARARLEGAARLWWPYVKGSVPVVRRERDAMEGFSRLVLTVSHVVGHEIGGMQESRERIVRVLRESLDIDRLRDVVKRREDEAKAAATGAAGIMASLTAMMSPITFFRNVRKYARFVPPPARVAIAAIVVAAVASVPFVAGYSAGRHAEAAALQEPAKAATPSKDDIRRIA